MQNKQIYLDQAYSMFNSFIIFKKAFWGWKLKIKFSFSSGQYVDEEMG